MAEKKEYKALKGFDWQKEYDLLHTSFPGYQRRPVIGITGNFGEKGCELAEGYYRSVLEAGGTPLIIPPYEDRDALLSTLDQVDALLLSGGGDMNPLFVGEDPLPTLHGISPRRDLCELLLIRLAFDRQIPMLGICRGIQMMATALGGAIYQDLGSQYHEAPLIKHDQTLDRCYASHKVNIQTDSLLYDILQTDELAVNSFHHQAVSDAGPHLRVSARSTDGVIEAIESTEYKSLLGVQWHPECFILAGNRCMMPLFDWLVGEAKEFAEARKLQHEMLTLDSHCDTPMFFQQGVRFDHRDDHVLVDLHKMEEGGLDGSIMVAYIPQKERDEAGLKAAKELTDSLLSQLEEMVEANHDHVEFARTPVELSELKKAGKHAIMKGIENGYAIGKDLSLLSTYRQRGIVYITLCHNGDNDICDSARGNAEHGGLSHFGKQVVAEMNRLGILVDLSHAAESTFWDVLKESKLPVVCSHSSCRALCDHPRNLTDEQMKALAEKGGVMQVTFYNGFLKKEGQATLQDALNHIDHAVKIMGIDHVGIGTDFDGDGGVPGLASASELINLTRGLIKRGYSHEDIQKLWGLNFLTVMFQNQKQAQ